MMNFNPISRPEDYSLPIQHNQLNTSPEQGYFPSTPDEYVDMLIQRNSIPANQPVSNTSAQGIVDLATQNTNATTPGPSDEWSPINTGNKVIDYAANLIPNALHDIPEVAQGALTMLRHPLQTVVNPLTDWTANKAPYLSTGERLGDIVNTLFGNAVGVDAKKATEFYKALFSGDNQKAKQIQDEMRAEFGEHFRKDPLITASVIAPGTLAKGVGKATKAAGQTIENVSKGKIPLGEAGRTAERISDLAVSEVAPEFRGIRVSAKELVETAKKTEGGNVENNLAEVIRRRENGLEIPERLKKVDEAYTKFYNKYMDSLPKYGLESTQSLTMSQFRANKTNKTFNEAARDFRPLEEILYDGIDDGTLADVEATLNGLKSENVLKGKARKKLDSLSAEEQEAILKYVAPEELGRLQAEGKILNNLYRDLEGTISEKKFTKGKNLTKEQELRYQENLNKISELAANGDEIASSFLEAHSAWKNGLLKPTIKAGIKDVALAGNLGEEALQGRRLAGKASSREYGTATPEQIAKAYAQNIDEVVTDLANAKLDRLVSERLLEGTFSDGTPLVNNATKTVKYLDAELLRDGRVKSALSSAKDTPFPDSIPIDVNFHNALNNQFGNVSSSLFSGVMGDVYGLLKDAILSSGTYLGGNALSGTANALINSNIFLLDDFINATKTKGAIAQKLGVYRDLGLDTRKFQYGASKGLHKVNRAVGGKVWTDLDAMLQNTFAEMAAHANLRRQGVKAGSRLDTLGDMSKLKLADLIKDAKLTALINPSRTLVPKAAQPFLGLNPFWRWQDTAAQASYHVLMQHPYLSQMVASNFFGTIGFDKEAQIRQGLNVKTDKLLRTYVPDSKTGGAKEVTMDFLPQLTTVKAVMEPESLMRTVPFLGDMVNAAQGKNAYGRPMQRTHSGFRDFTRVQRDKRYKFNEKTGQIEELGTQADELISTLLKDISGVPNFYNKTIGPAIAGLANAVSGTNNYTFYQPAGQSVFGSYTTGQPDNLSAMFKSGDPTKGLQGQDLIRRILNMYETPYYPENQARINKDFYKGFSGRSRLERDYLEGRR